MKVNIKSINIQPSTTKGGFDTIELSGLIVKQGRSDKEAMSSILSAKDWEKSTIEIDFQNTELNQITSGLNKKKSNNPLIFTYEEY